MRIEADPQTHRQLKQKFGWAIGWGILLIILGILALAVPLLSAIYAVLVVGWMFVFGGITKIVYALQTRSVGQFLLRVLIGILYVVAGFFLIVRPLEGTLSLALALGIFTFMQGVIEVILAFQWRPTANWGWVLLSGIVDVILGILILNYWPSAAPWLIGLLFGVNLLTSGLWIVMVSSSARNALRQADSQS